MKPETAEKSPDHPGFYLQIETQGQAFEGDHLAGSPGVVSLLRKVCIELGAGETAGNIKDVNSKVVGAWHYAQQGEAPRGGR